MALKLVNGQWVDDGQTDNLSSASQTTAPIVIKPPTVIPNNASVLPPDAPPAAPVKQTEQLPSVPQNLSEGYYSTIDDIFSGKAFDPTRSAMNEASARAGANLRATAAAGSAGRIGQGSAVATQNAVEQNLASTATANVLAVDQAEQASKLQALQPTLEAANLASTTQLEWGKLGETARQYNITNSSDMQKFNETMKYDYAALSQADKQFLANLGMDQAKFEQAKAEFSQTYGLQSAQLQETARQFNITNATDVSHFQDTLKLNYAQLSQADKQFLTSFGLDEAKFNEAKSQFSQTMNYQYKELAQSAELTKLGISSGEKIAGMQVSSNQTIAGMQIASAQKIAADQNWLQQQGVDIQKASVMGYTDASGKHVAGSAEIAAQELGLKSTQIKDAQNELYGYTDSKGVYHPGAMDNADASTKQRAAELYGYTDANGNHIAGSLELQRDQVAIQKQGMDLETAKTKGYIDDQGVYHQGTLGIAAQQAKQEADQLYGFKDPSSGEYVPGTAQLAARQFGLQSQTLELQRQELFGFDDPKTGKHIPGKYDFMSAEEKRAADALYGTDPKDSSGNPVLDKNGNPVHIAGTMELQQDQVEIQKQGLSLDEAKLKGYDGPNGHISGDLENAATALDLQSRSYEDQRKEIFGYYDGANKKWVNGKIDNMNQEQQNAMYQLYGDPVKGIKGTLELQNETVATQNQVARDTYASNYGGTLSNGTKVTGLQGRAMAIQEDSAAAAKYWDTSKKIATYAATHLDADGSDPALVSLMADWYKEQTGQVADTSSRTFKGFVNKELAAAQDKRLTNPIDESIYAINSATGIDETTKKQMVAVLTASPDWTFTTDANGKVTATYKSASSSTASGSSSPGSSGSSSGSTTFTPDAGMVFDNITTKGQFTEGGAIWNSTSGTNQSTTPLVDGQKITLGTNFTVQNSDEVVPSGNYTSGSFGGGTVKTLTNADSGKTYVINKPAGNYGKYTIQNGVATSGSQSGFIIKSNNVKDVTGAKLDRAQDFTDAIVYDKAGNKYSLVKSSNGQTAYIDSNWNSYKPVTGSDGDITFQMI